MGTPKQRGRLRHAALVEEDLADIAVAERCVAGVARLRARLATAPVELHRFAPPPVEIREATEVVEDGGLAVQVTERCVEREGTLRVLRSGRAPGFHERPVEDQQRVSERRVLTGRLRLGD